MELLKEKDAGTFFVWFFFVSMFGCLFVLDSGASSPRWSWNYQVVGDDLELLGFQA